MIIYNSLIHSYLNGGILLWGFEPGRLVVLQKKAIRAISFSKYNAHTTNLFRELKILKVVDIFNFRALKFYHNLMHNKVPEYFKDKLMRYYALNNSHLFTIADLTGQRKKYIIFWLL